MNVEVRFSGLGQVKLSVPSAQVCAADPRSQDAKVAGY